MVQKPVFRLQKRIYLSSRDSDVKQVRRLQNTLVHSFSAKALAVRRVTQEKELPEQMVEILYFLSHNGIKVSYKGEQHL